MSWTADGLLADGSSWRRADESPSGARPAAESDSTPGHRTAGDWTAEQLDRDRAQAVQDEALLERAVAGDEQAFVTLYGRWQGPIYRFVWHLSASETLAEDVTQEVFVALATERHAFDATRGRVSGYLFGMARNLALRRLRREQIYASMPGEGDFDPGLLAPHGAVSEIGPEAALDRREAVQRVRHAVYALPLVYREAVALCDLQEMSYAEAAGIIGCPVGTVRSRLHRGRAMLAACLTQDPLTRDPLTRDPMKGGAP